MKIEKMAELMQMVVKAESNKYTDYDTICEKLEDDERDFIIEDFRFKVGKRGNSYHMQDYFDLGNDL